MAVNILVHTLEAGFLCGKISALPRHFNPRGAPALGASNVVGDVGVWTLCLVDLTQEGAVFLGLTFLLEANY